MEFIMAMMAGEKAAKHFIHRYPKLFEGRNPEPVSPHTQFLCEISYLYMRYEKGGGGVMTPCFYRVPRS